MPHSIPEHITNKIAEQCLQFPIPIYPDDIVDFAIKIGQFGYSLGKAESTRDEYLKQQSKKP